MAQVGIRAFKAELRRYLREVENGGTLLLTDRGRVVAEVSPPAAAKRRARPTRKSGARAMLAELVERGVVRPAIRPNRDWLKLPLLRLPPGTARRLLDADRGE